MLASVLLAIAFSSKTSYPPDECLSLRVRPFFVRLSLVPTMFPMRNGPFFGLLPHFFFFGPLHANTRFSRLVTFCHTALI